MASGRKPDAKRRAEIARLRAKGLSLAEIGRRLGVSRQSVQVTLRAMARPAVRTVACSACGAAVVSEGALPSDAKAALCLRCLGRRPGTPFGQRLKACRLAAGLTKADLARRAGFRPQMLRHYETGLREPRWTQLARLVAVLGPALVTAGVAERTA
jgi:transcriptional regulator with XRE-family HTH domain